MSHSVTTRIIVFGLIVLLIGSAAWTLLLSTYLRDDIVRMSSSQLLTLANYAAQDIDHNISGRRDLLRRLAESFPLEYLDNPPRARAWLAERHRIHPAFSQGLMVLDPDGIPIAGYPVAVGPETGSFSDRDYFRRAKNGEFAIGRPVVGRVSKVPLLPMGMPLRDSTGAVRAVLAGASALRAPDFLDALYRTRVGKEGGLILVSPQDELFVGASTGGIALKQTPPKGVHRQHDQAMQGFRGVGIDVNMGGVEELAAVVSVPSSGWFLVARLPTEEVFAPVSGLHRFMAGNTVILTILFVIVLVAGLRYLLGPLRQAARHADRMISGEIPLEPLPVVRRDEVGNLTEAYNRVLTKLLESRAEMEHLAHHDPLTGLPNRNLLADNLKKGLARSQRAGTMVTILFLDLDGFKLINDNQGHDAGDDALRQVATRLQGVVRCEDTLARAGGDEFVILLTDQQGEVMKAAELVAGKCRAVFNEPFELKGELFKIGVSIGIAVGAGNCEPDKLLIAADQAMYRAKQAGSGRVCWADEL